MGRHEIYGDPVQMESEDRPQASNLLERIANERAHGTRSWLGSAVVIICAAFLLLTLNEGQAGSYQRYVDFVFHNWMLMAGSTTVLWFARGGAFGDLPRLFRGLANLLLPFFVVFSFFALLSSPLLWAFLKPLGLVRTEAVPVAILGAVALFTVGSVWMLLRGFFRWMGGRYEHHGMAVGLGPIYFYFWKRKSP